VSELFAEPGVAGLDSDPSVEGGREVSDEPERLSGGALLSVIASRALRARPDEGEDLRPRRPRGLRAAKRAHPIEQTMLEGVRIDRSDQAAGPSP
jgi:hypothetical protein